MTHALRLLGCAAFVWMMQPGAHAQAPATPAALPPSAASAPLHPSLTHASRPERVQTTYAFSCKGNGTARIVYNADPIVDSRPRLPVIQINLRPLHNNPAVRERLAGQTVVGAQGLCMFERRPVLVIETRSAEGKPARFSVEIQPEGPIVVIDVQR